jgi:hypothetical protein
MARRTLDQVRLGVARPVDPTYPRSENIELLGRRRAQLETFRADSDSPVDHPVAGSQGGDFDRALGHGWVISEDYAEAKRDSAGSRILQTGQP